ncbi:conserved hypothetical protein [Mycobacterium tuberculosis T92]|nr:conserved hypothetical protein [Mycobacterium tuberculosis T92]
MSVSFTVGTDPRIDAREALPAGGTTATPRPAHRDFWRGYCRAALRSVVGQTVRHGSESGSAPAVAFVAAARRGYRR